MTANQRGPCVQLFAGRDAVPTLQDLARSTRSARSTSPARCSQHGVATLPRGMMYLSAAHTDADIDATLTALTEAIQTLA